LLAFIIPVQSKATTSDWHEFSCLLNRCINSICNQNNTNFKVIVACHEIPETNFKNDSRVEFLQMKFSPPILTHLNQENLIVKRADKSKKLKVASEHALKMGFPYVMTVDSDDCVSNKICDFVCKNADDSVKGWYINKGYLYTEGKKYSFLNLKNFNEVCGSCIIIKPDLIELLIDDLLYFNHERTIVNNEKLKPLPFPGAVYSMLNGNNIRLDKKELKNRTEFNLFKIRDIKTIIRRLKKYRIVPIKIIKSEFSI